MRLVIEEAVRLMKKREACVLATVVRTKGSTPQKAGAKLLVRHDGSGVGTLGGGCVEGDIWFAAKEILRKGSGPEFKDYFLNEDIAARDGLVCGGSMYFFIEPIRTEGDDFPFVSEILKAYEGGPAVALATVANTGQGKKNLGAKLLIREDGSTEGSLYEPFLEELAVKAGRRVAVHGVVEQILGKNGEEIFVEGFTTPPTLILMGGGHVGKAISNLATTLGFRIYIVDDRPEFANKERFPEAEGIVVSEFHKGLEKLSINTNTFILVATRGHRYDDLALEAAIHTPARYVGLLGSKRKSIMIYKNLLDKGVPLKKIKNVQAPVGLDIGAITPEELAVSIMAEIIMCRLGGDGRSMKMKDKYLAKITQKQAEPWAPSVHSF